MINILPQLNRLLIIMIMLLLIQACGQKGPLEPVQYFYYKVSQAT